MSDWYHNVPELLKQTDTIYERLVALGKPDKHTLTKQKVYDERGWGRAASIIEKNFDEQLRRLGLFYIPKVFQPGPCFVFPLTDADGVQRRAQTRPLPGSDLYSERAKYYMLGDKDLFLGPTWIGNDNQTILQILNTRSVTLVEGGFDLLACRLLVPELPTLSPLTKKVGKKHVIWLRMLGVQTIYLLFDHEKSGKGDEAMHFTKEDLKGFTVHVIEQFGGGDDPSSALKDLNATRRLYNTLFQLTGDDNVADFS